MNWKGCLNSLKSSIKIIINFFFLLLILSTTSFSQEDSLSIQSLKQSQDTTFVMQKSPWGAVLQSAVLPGLGQIYNESYWKAPLIWGIAGWFVYNWIDNNNLYKDNRTLFLETGESIYKLRRDFYRDQRDNFTIYFVFLYFLNLVDAYVDAHLYDFNVQEDFMNRSFNINLRINF